LRCKNEIRNANRRSTVCKILKIFENKDGKEKKEEEINSLPPPPFNI
jgi:hypothetical protein